MQPVNGHQEAEIMGHYLKSPKTGKFYYNPTIKRSTLLRDYQRTTPIRPMIAGKRHRTWERKPKFAEPRVYEYTLYQKYDFEARTYLKIEEGDDPYSKQNMKLAEEKIRYGLRRKLNVKGYWSGFHDAFWEAGFTQGVRKAAGDVEQVFIWEKKTGKTFKVAVGAGRV